MGWRALEFIIGLCLAGATLRDVFFTVVVPGSTRGILQVSRRLVRSALAVWKQFRRRGISVNFAPVLLVGSFVTWMFLLVLAFGLMVHSLSESFEPAIDGVGQALYIAAGALTTMGFGATEPLHWARGVTVIASFCGLAVMTLAVTYLIEIQSNIARRDTGVLKISTSSGHPPCALALLERYSLLGSRAELVDVLREGRTWCATVLQSHATHPWLVYFRSVGTASGWPAALGTLSDVSVIVELLIEDSRMHVAAVLAREQSERLANGLVEMLGLESQPAAASLEDAERLCARLTAAGYRLREDRDIDRFLATRNRLAGAIEAMAQHLNMQAAPLLPRVQPDGYQ